MSPMRFSLLVAASARDLFQVPTQNFRASRTMDNYPAVYEAPYAGMDNVVPVPVVESYIAPESSTNLMTPVVVVALAVAGYAVGRAATSSVPAPSVAAQEVVTVPENVAMLSIKGQSDTRREVLAKAGAAALAGLAAVDSASAKSGQFSKIEIFSVIGTPGISSPYQPGGPKAGADATFGYTKSAGEFVANGYENDVTREKAAFDVSKKIVQSQQANIDSKTWWLVRDNLRGQAYNMKANMLAINKTLSSTQKAEAASAYATFWQEINSLDLACRKKELSLAQKEYQDVLAALQKYENAAFA